MVQIQPLFLLRPYERFFSGGAGMNHLISKIILFTIRYRKFIFLFFTKIDPYDTMKGVKPKAYLGNRIREQFYVLNGLSGRSKGVF